MSNIADGKTGLSVLEPQSSLIDYGAAAVSGAVSATGIPVGGSVLANAGIGFVKEVGKQVTSENYKGEIDWLKVGFETVVGGVSGLAGGSGMKCSANISKLTKQVDKKIFLRL